MPNYTKKHRTFRKKIGGAHHQRAYTNWVGKPGNTYAVDLRRYGQRPYRQPHPDPETSYADALKHYLRNVTRHYGNKISNSRTITALRSLLNRTPTPIVETPPPARPSNNTASTASTKLSKTIKPSIKKKTLRSSRRLRSSQISRILRRSQR